MSPDVRGQRFYLPFTAVLLCAFDREKRLIPNANASGFIRREGGKHFLYTCWHVVTGFDPNDVQIRGHDLPRRRFLQVSLQMADKAVPGLEKIGGLQSHLVPLYDESCDPPKPLWQQDDAHLPHPDLNAIGLYVPFWHDAVKLELPENLSVSNMQVLGQGSAFTHSSTLAMPGDKCYVVGYPYGFSAQGQSQPTPVVLSRFVAGRAEPGPFRLLLESVGAPGMSGGPVFIEFEDSIVHIGIYTGAIFPRQQVAGVDLRVTDLGVVSEMAMHLDGRLPFVASPSKATKRPPAPGTIDRATLQGFD